MNGFLSSTPISQEVTFIGYLRRRFQSRRIRKTKAEFLAQLDEAREHEGSFDRSQSFDVSPYYWESGIGGGPYYCVKQATKAVNRSIRRGDFKTTTPYSKTVYELNGSTGVGFVTSVKHPNGGYTAKRWRSYSDASAQWWGGYNVSQDMRSKLVSSSQVALLSKMRNMAPTWDVLTSAAELKETLGSIKGAATWFATLIKHVSLRNMSGILRHLRLKKTKANKRRIVSCYTDSNGINHYYSSSGSVVFKQLDVMQNLWMNYRYTMMTTIYDMQDALIALAAPKRAKDYELTAQVTLKDGCSVSGSSDWIPCYGGWSDTQVSYSHSLSINGSIRKKVWFSFYEDILNRLNPDTIISMCKTAWELGPFSWVADWFLGISDYLRLLELGSLIQKSDVCVTERGSVRSTYYLTGYKVDVPDQPGYSGSTNLVVAPGSGVSIGESFYFDRSIGSVSVPSWSPSESWYTWKRGLDVASLSWQNVRNSLHEYLPRVRV